MVLRETLFLQLEYMFIEENSENNDKQKVENIIFHPIS